MVRYHIAAVGDVLVDRDDPLAVTRHLEPVIANVAIAFCNFEGVLTDNHEPLPGAAHATVVPAKNATGLTKFTVASLANNHSMDAGYGGLFDTIDALESEGLTVVGAGPSLSAAMEPRMLEAGGLSVAFIAVASVFSVGTQARAALPGIAPLRVQDYYAPRHPGDYGSGVPPRIMSVVDPEDWDRLVGSIDHAKASADMVFVSIHWGDYSRPWVITDNERGTARRLRDAGVDAILGHHQHIFRGMEVTNGTPVYYGLGHLVFDHPRFPDELLVMDGIDINSMSDHERRDRFGEFGVYPRRDSPIPFHPLARQTGVALMEYEDTSCTRAGVIPCYIDDDGIPFPQRRGTDEWLSSCGFFEQSLSRGGLSANVSDDGWIFHGYDVLRIY